MPFASFNVSRFLSGPYFLLFTSFVFTFYCICWDYIIFSFFSSSKTLPHSLTLFISCFTYICMHMYMYIHKYTSTTYTICTMLSVCRLLGLTFWYSIMQFFLLPPLPSTTFFIMASFSVCIRKTYSNKYINKTCWVHLYSIADPCYWISN